MPVNRKLMKNLRREYGTAKGKRVYYAMEAKAAAKEKREHPWMTRSQARRVAADHLRKGSK